MAIREGDLVFPALKFIVRSGDAGVSTMSMADTTRPTRG